MTEEHKRRISITKLQRETAVGVELIALCQSVSQDGKLTDEEVAALRQWLADSHGSDLPAINVLRETVDVILADGVVTDDERRKLYQVIETVLPIDIRQSVRGQRLAVEKIEKEAARESVRAAADEERRRNTPIGKWDFMVAGAFHEGRPETINLHANSGDSAFLVRDPANQYSRNAVEVRLSNGMQIGYVPERFAVEIAPLLDAGHIHDAFIKKILSGGRSPIPVVIANVYPVAESKAVNQDSKTLNTAGVESEPVPQVRHFFTEVVGVTKRNSDGTSRQRIIRELGEDHFIKYAPDTPKLIFDHEEDNPVDPNAVKVCTEDGEQIGYLNRELAKEVAGKNKLGYRYAGFLDDVTGGEEDKPTLGVNLLVIEVEPGVSDETAQQYMNKLLEELRGPPAPPRDITQEELNEAARIVVERNTAAKKTKERACAKGGCLGMALALAGPIALYFYL